MSQLLTRETPFVTILDHFIANGQSQPFWISPDFPLRAQLFKSCVKSRDTISRELPRAQRVIPSLVCRYGRDLAGAHTDSSTGTRPPVLELTIPAAPPALVPALTCFWPSHIHVVALSEALDQYLH